MSTLNAPSRISRRTPARSTPVQTQAQLQAPASVDGLIEWSRPGEDLWVGKIHLDHAGMIERVGDRYVVTDWKNERVGTCNTLTEAQRILEPATRLSAQEAADRLVERQQWIAGTTVTTALVIAATLGGWAVSSL